jgi:RNA polymerase sigma factor (sigma-70 family)
MFAVAEILILVLALVVAVLRQFTGPVLLPLRLAGTVYVDLARGVPGPPSRRSPVVEPGDAADALRIDGLHKSFGAEEVLCGIDLTVAAHEVICLIGASGSGKSTLLRCVNLLERIDAGTIWLGGQLISGPGADQNLVRRHITLAPVKVLGRSRAEAVARATELLERFGLAEKRPRRYDHADRHARDGLRAGGRQPGVLPGRRADRRAGTARPAVQPAVGRTNPAVPAPYRGRGTPVTRPRYPTRQICRCLWPLGGRATTVTFMQDRDVVTAVVAGDPNGIAAAYDRYAMPLYSYCRSLLREPADAADAVQDTFLVATAKLGDLRDPGKLRPWLFAVARNVCHRKLSAGSATAALDEAADLTAQGVDVAGAVEQAELRRLVRDALAGLNPGERDVIELSLVHGLDVDELADALGVSRNHAHALQSRARGQLERSLGALLVARTGRPACPALDRLLTGWDGQLTVLLRKRISRHIEQCQTCGEVKRRELSPALFAGALPLVALLPEIREHVLEQSADRSPAGLAHRAEATELAGQFGPTGFPRPVSPPGAPGWHRVLRHSHALTATVATAAAAAGISAVLIIGGGAPPSHAGAGARASAGPGGVIANSRGAPAQGPPGPPGAGRSGRPPSAGPGGSTAPAVLVTGPGSRQAPATSGSTAGSSGSSRSSSGSTAPASGSSSSAPAPASSSAPAGTLAVPPGRLVLVVVNGHGTGTFTLTAQGGPVRFSISAAADLSVSPASGTLAAGASATITVTSSSLIALDEQLTVNPGGYTVTVVLSVSR